MGIYDREYYRDETRGGWLSGNAPICRALLAVNIAIFLAQWIFRDADLALYLGASSSDIFRRGRVWELVTAAFFHMDGWHIAMNMLVLWFFGRDLEGTYGSREFLAFYLAAAVVGTLAWAVINQFGPSQGQGRMFGASGAVMAVFVVYALFHPRQEVLFMFLVPVPIWLLLVLYIGYDFLNLMRELEGRGSAGVAFAAHLGGAAFGYLYKTQGLRLSGWWRFRPFRPRLRVFSPSSSEASAGSRAADSPRGGNVATGTSGSRPSVSVIYPEEQLDARVDEILAKIAREGRTGLSDEENRILLEASRRAKMRRSER
jgi:membrane associated rhomboid family serine protease